MLYNTTSSSCDQASWGIPFVTMPTAQTWANPCRINNYCDFCGMTQFTPDQLAFLQAQRAGRLATATSDGAPHVIPVCYACDGASLYIALDAKPKRVAPERLRRIRNILENPRVALVIDRYSDDWSELAYLLIQGIAALVRPGDAEHSRAVA